MVTFLRSIDEQWNYSFSFNHAVGQYVCTFCVVPLPADERSREPQSIMSEIQDLWDKGFKEITLRTKRR
jgi:radical SAM superfamily enzyme with C-terminal helix-hairpin-helix motif